MIKEGIERIDSGLPPNLKRLVEQAKDKGASLMQYR